MLIRHAEKHSHGSHDRGVTADGHPSHHELTVRGWQRATALVHLFAPAEGIPDSSPICTPRSIFATDPTRLSPSLRAMHTAGPLAEKLGIAINHDYTEGEESALAAAAIAAPAPVLIVWHHNHIAGLVKAIAGDPPGCPGYWPDERFDLVWILERLHSGWRFCQVAQRLLPDDCIDPIQPAKSAAHRR